jgi:hypothetical protein
MSNKFVHELFNNKQFCDDISKIARQQIARRKVAYEACSIFDKEDLEQEIWAELLEDSIKTIDGAKNKALDIAEMVANRGRRKTSFSEYREIPISQLGETERRKTNNLFYGSSFCDIA